MRRHSSFSLARCHPERSEGSLNLGIRPFVGDTVHRRLCDTVASVRFLASLGMTAVIFCSSAGLLRAQEQSATAISREVKDVFDRAAKAVVKIEATDQHGELSGTGFFVDPTGTLYTAYSVGGEAENLTVEFKGKKYPARQLLADLRSGIAMLKVDLASP